MGFQQSKYRRCGEISTAGRSVHARPTAANSPISKGGSRSRKPTGSSGLMAGAGKRSNPVVFSLGKTAARSCLSISLKCGSRSRPMGQPSIREGHGSGEGRGTSPGEVHDIALKAAETDATKRAFATFGKPFGLELYRQAARRRIMHGRNTLRSAATRFGFHPDDTTPIPRPSRYYGLRQQLRHRKNSFAQLASSAPPLAPMCTRLAGQRRSTKALLPYPNPNVAATNRIYVSSPRRPCLVCGRHPSDPHHLRFAQPRALGV